MLALFLTRKPVACLLLLLIHFSCCAAKAQISNAAAADDDLTNIWNTTARLYDPAPSFSPWVVTPQPPDLVAPHAFWDPTNLLLFSGVAVFRGLDYASTRNMQARGRREILLAQDVVNNSAGFASLEAAGAATSVGISYWLHRAGHHKLERWMSISHVGITGFGVARNYALRSKHPPVPQ